MPVQCSETVAGWSKGCEPRLRLELFSFTAIRFWVAQRFDILLDADFGWRSASALR